MTDSKKDARRIAGRDCPKFRVSFPKVFKAEAFEDQAPKYSCTMLFDESLDLSIFKKAVHAAKVKKWGADKTQWPKKIRSPFRDGNEKQDLEGYKGMIYITASNKHRPQVVGPDKAPIAEETDEFYAGCYARASLNAFAYETKTKTGAILNRGVSFSLENIQKVGEGKRFSGRIDAEDSFDEIESASSDDTSSDDDDQDGGF